MLTASPSSAFKLTPCSNKKQTQSDQPTAEKIVFLTSRHKIQLKLTNNDSSITFINNQLMYEKVNPTGLQKGIT